MRALIIILFIFHFSLLGCKLNKSIDSSSENSNPNPDIIDTEPNLPGDSGGGGSINSSSCPTNYILVPGSSDPGSRSTDFCISKYEMKAKEDASGNIVDGIPIGIAGAGTHTPVSVPEERPWGAVDFATARSECASLGAAYHLVTNAEWMTVARNIESQIENWSGGSVGSGMINTGHSDGSIIGGQDYLAASSDDIQACFGTGNPNCNNPLDSDFLQKRTHILSNDEVIWDLAGNLNSWVDPIGDGSLLSYDGNVSPAEWSAIYQINGTNPMNSVYATSNILLGSEHFLPKFESSYVGQLDDYGLGIIRKEDSPGQVNKGMFRGGAFAETLTWENRIGIFSVWIEYDATVSWSNLGFRCVYEP